MRLLSSYMFVLIGILIYPVDKLVICFTRHRFKSEIPPVFIIGPPRSGSTLLYKLLTERYRFSFFSEWISLLYRTPATAFLLQKVFGIEDQPGVYTFHYGEIPGAGNPSECGNFWYRWFPRAPQVHVPKGGLPASRLKQMRRELQAFQVVAGQPLLIKNLFNSMRIGPLMEAFPNARFIICRRDPVDNAVSIMKARIRSPQGLDHWWSLPPKEYAELKGLPWPTQIAGQIGYIYRQIEDEKRDWGDDHFFEVSYEQLCNDTYSVLVGIENFLKQGGITLPARFDVPTRFDTQCRSSEIETEAMEQIVTAFTDFDERWCGSRSSRKEDDNVIAS